MYKKVLVLCLMLFVSNVAVASDCFDALTSEGDKTEHKILSQQILSASVSGNVKQVNLLLKKYPDLINVQSELGRTPLILAVQMGHYDIVKLLLNHPDIDVNVQDLFGLSALMYANGGTIERKSMVELLFSHPNIDLNLQNHVLYEPSWLLSNYPGASLKTYRGMEILAMFWDHFTSLKPDASIKDIGSFDDDTEQSLRDNGVDAHDILVIRMTHGLVRHLLKPDGVGAIEVQQNYQSDTALTYALKNRHNDSVSLFLTRTDLDLDLVVDPERGLTVSDLVDIFKDRNPY